MIEFKLNEKENELAEEFLQEHRHLEIYKGTISYEFYPCAGIGWGVKVHVMSTGETIDIRDVSTW